MFSSFSFLRGTVSSAWGAVSASLLWSFSLSVRFPQQSELSSEERQERFGPLQQHRRAVASLNKQVQTKVKQLEQVSPTPLLHRRRGTHGF